MKKEHEVTAEETTIGWLLANLCVILARMRCADGGQLRPAAYSLIAGWFSGTAVDRLLPILSDPVASDRRNEQIDTTIHKMINVCGKASNCPSSLPEEDARIWLDLLWQDLFTLHAPMLNEIHKSFLSTTSAYRSKRLARFARLTGMQPSEVLVSARSNRRVHETISNLGIAYDDLAAAS